MNQKPIFETKDTSLAAFLYTIGFQLEEVKTEKFPSVFLFIFDNGIEEKAYEFQVGKAIVNAKLYHEAYRKCLKMTRVGKL